uniref:Ciliary associated calcium binding coiled-coil 1 n=2 Tax=Xiphophorus TaxID=8082 RepID=A0A3B5PW52_XIPMA
MKINVCSSAESLMYFTYDTKKFLQWDALPVQLIEELQEHSAEELLKMENILGFTNHRTCIREAVLLQYYLSGFWWAKDTKFSPTQISFTMAVLHVLLENLREKQMSSVDNMVVFMKAMTAACHCAPSEEDDSSLLNNNEAKALICYVTKSLILKYKLYELLFMKSTEERLTGMERTIQRFGCQDAHTSLEESISTYFYFK